MEKFVSLSKEVAPDRARRQRLIVDKISANLNSYGYLELNLPNYENYDILKETSHGFSDESIIKFIDRDSGKTLVLRPDFTPQVCRTVTSYMANYPLPLRVYYRGSVFRIVNSNRGNGNEQFQVGWELFGGDELCGDLEMLLTTINSLDDIGLKGFKIVIGDSKFLARLFELAKDCDINEPISEKSTFKLDKILQESKADSAVKSLIKKLPLLFGDISVIEELKKDVSFDNVLKERIDYIAKLYNRLISLNSSASNSVVFDISETKGLDYYTGINFEIVHADCGFSLGGGGRYDNLMYKFGKNISACGIALHIEELMQFAICFDSGETFDYIIIGNENLQLAEEYRRNGKSVLFIQSAENLEDFKKIYRFKNIIGGSL